MDAKRFMISRLGNEDILEGLNVTRLHDSPNFHIALLDDDQRAVVRERGAVHFELPEEPKISLRGQVFDFAELADDAIAPGVEHYLVELPAPPQSAWLKALRDGGARPLEYVNEHAVLVHLPQGQASDLLQLDFVSGVAPFLGDTERKASPTIRNWLESRRDDVRCVAALVFGRSIDHGQPNVPLPPERRSGLEAFGNLVDDGVKITHYWRVVLESSAEQVRGLLAQPWVYGVEPAPRMDFHDGVSSVVAAGETGGTMNYREWLKTAGVTGDGVTIAFWDEGYDPEHVALLGSSGKSRSTYKFNTDKKEHGTMVAGQAAGGDVAAVFDAEGFSYGIGMAPEAALMDVLGPEDCVSAEGRAQILNCSWGDDDSENPIFYTSAEAYWDRAVRDAYTGNPEALTVCFSAGNRGVGGITHPAAAKNVITSGCSHSPRIVADQPYESIDTVWTDSSHGTCVDKRIKPDVVAPAQLSSAPTLGAPKYGLVSAVPGAPAAASAFGFAGETSSASAITAGACALIIEWYRGLTGAIPSPAMVKALLINRATFLGAGGPDLEQGWGRIDVDKIVRADVHLFLQDEEGSLLNATSTPSRTFLVKAADTALPMRATLVWTDPPPGAISGAGLYSSALTNLLTLTAKRGGDVWHANDFLGTGEVESGGGIINNVQVIDIDPGAGDCDLEVAAVTLTADCKTPWDTGTPVLQQDFALVISNAVKA
ncbi:MAG: S8 family serine peptidase [Planctomycetota bacterium]